MQMLWLKGLQREVIGQVFETGVFAELVKKYSGESVFYWRTKDKKEIDFILKMKDSLIPIEVKLNYEQFNPTAIRYFNEHYGIDNYRVVGLNGRDSGSGLYSCCVAPRAGAWGPGIKSLWKGDAA